MLRNLIIAGLSAVAAASLPALYQTDPERFQRLVGSSPEAVESGAAIPDRIEPLKLAAPQTEALLGRKVRLPADERGHFLAGFKLNGRSVEALIDTGATTVAINRTTARRIGLHLRNVDFKYEVRTANGATRAASATIERMQIGRISIENVPAAVLDDAALDGTLIGISFLNRLSKFQVEGGSLLLVQ
ncbi:MAG: TIGR02281 family clan AA aspartic protease [Mesorhizobium sp.]